MPQGINQGQGAAFAKPEKLEPPHCDGWNHPWSSEAPIYCKGCGVRFTDADALEREMELAKRGYREVRGEQS